MSQDEKADWSELKFGAEDKLPEVKNKYIAFITANDPWWLRTIYDNAGTILNDAIKAQKTLSDMKVKGKFYEALRKLYDERKETHNAYKPLVKRSDINSDWSRIEDLGIDANDKAPARKEKLMAYLVEYAPEVLDKKVAIGGRGGRTVTLAIEKADGRDVTTLTPDDTVYNKIRDAYFEWPIAPEDDKKEVYNETDNRALQARRKQIEKFLNRTGEAGRRTLAEEMDMEGEKVTLEKTLKQKRFNAADVWFDNKVANLVDGTIYYYIRTRYREHHQDVERERKKSTGPKTNDNGPKTSPTVPTDDDDTIAASSTTGGAANQPQDLIPPWPLTRAEDGVKIGSWQTRNKRIDVVREFLKSSEVGRAVLDATINSGINRVDDNGNESDDMVKVSVILDGGKDTESRYNQLISWQRGVNQSPYENIKNLYNERRNAAIAKAVPWSIPRDIGTAVGRRTAITNFLKSNNSDLYNDGFVGYKGNDVNVRDLLEKSAYTADALWDPEDGVLYRLLENAYNGVSFNEADIKKKDDATDTPKTEPVVSIGGGGGGEEPSTSDEDPESLSDSDISSEEEDEKTVVADQLQKIEQKQTVIEKQAQQANKQAIVEKQLVAVIAEKTGDPNAGRLAEEAAQLVAQQVAAKDVQLEALRATNEELRRENQEKSEDLERVGREMAQLRARLEEENREMLVTVRSSAQVNDELATARREREEARAELQRLSSVETQLTELQNTSAVAEQQRLQAVEQATQLREQLRTKTEEVGEKTRANEALAAERATQASLLQQREAELATLRNTASGGGDINAALQQQLVEKDETIASLNTRVSDLQRDITTSYVPRTEYERLRDDEAEAQQQRTQAISEQERLTAQLVGVPALRDEVVALRERPTADQLAEVVAKNDNLTREAEAVQQRLDDAMTRLSRTESEANTAALELAQQKTRTAKLVARAQRRKRERDGARANLTAAREQIDQLINAANSGGTVDTGEVVARVERLELERLREEVERLEQADASLRQEKEALEAIPVWRVSDKKGIARSRGETVAGLDRVVAMQKADLDYIRTHWEFYRLLRIGFAGETISFQKFIDDHPNLMAQPGDTENKAGRFYYRVADFDFVKRLQGAQGGDVPIFDHRIGVSQSRAPTLGDYAMQSYLDSVIDSTTSSGATGVPSGPLSLAVLRTQPALGNHRIAVVFRDVNDRPVLGFVAQQLESHRLFKKGAAMDHVIVIDMKEHWAQLRYTASTVMGHTLFKNRGSILVRHEAGEGGRWERVYPFVVTPPHVVDLKYAYGQERVVTLGNDEGEVRASYVTPTYSALKRLVLPYRPSAPPVVGGEPQQGVLVVEKKKKKKKQPVVEPGDAGDAVVTEPVAPKIGEKKTVVIHFSERVPEDDPTSGEGLRASTHDMFRRILTGYRWLRADEKSIGAPPDAYRLFVTEGPVSSINLPIDLEYDMYQGLLTDATRQRLVLVLEPAGAAEWRPEEMREYGRVDYDANNETTTDDSVIQHMRAIFTGWTSGQAVTSSAASKQTVLLVPSTSIKARVADGRLVYGDIVSRLNLYSTGQNIQWRMIDNINVTALDLVNARRVFLAELPEGAVFDVSVERGLTGLDDYKAYASTVEKPAVVALNQSTGLEAMSEKNRALITQILIDAEGNVIDRQQGMENRIGALADRLSSPMSDTGRRRRRVESTSESSSTGGSGTASSFFDFSSSDISSTISTGERASGNNSDIYEIVDYSSPMTPLRSDVSGTTTTTSDLLDDDDGVFDAIATW